jgi:hypothetical protein
MLRLRPPSHTPIEINDTKILRFHIAILKKKTQNEDGQVTRAQAMTCTRMTIMSEANAQPAYGNPCGCKFNKGRNALIECGALTKFTVMSAYGV